MHVCLFVCVLKVVQSITKEIKHQLILFFVIQDKFPYVAVQWLFALLMEFSEEFVIQPHFLKMQAI
jgi:hypothetical protein